MIQTRKDAIQDPQTLSKKQRKDFLHQVQQMPKGRQQAEYATQADFCRAFARDIEHVYLLAFLLTANHQDAEKCFVIALEEIPIATVPKDCVSPWIRRRLIKAAIGSILRQPSDDQRPHDEWWGARSTAATLINAVTRLPSLERFVFVMSLLEGYSIKQCCLLLDCSEHAVIKTKIRALQELPLLQGSNESSLLSGCHPGKGGLVAQDTALARLLPHNRCVARTAQLPDGRQTRN